MSVENPVRAVIVHVPLYEHTEEQMPDLQVASQSDAEYFWQTERPGKMTIEDFFPGFQKISTEDILFLNKNEFKDPAHADGIHGRGHMARTVINGSILGQYVGLDNESFED